MGKAIKQVKSGLIVGHAGLGFRGGVTGSVRQQVHDGDTINVRALGNFGVRFLGVDAPEISFKLPGEERFTGLSNIRWERYLSDPFTNWPRKSRLNKDLIDHLDARILLYPNQICPQNILSRKSPSIDKPIWTVGQLHFG